MCTHARTHAYKNSFVYVYIGSTIDKSPQERGKKMIIIIIIRGKEAKGEENEKRKIRSGRDMLHIRSRLQLLAKDFSSHFPRFLVAAAVTGYLSIQ